MFQSNMYWLTVGEGVVFVWCMQAEGKVEGVVLLADGQTFVCLFLLYGVQHVYHQLLQAVGRRPSPVSPGVGVIEPHRPAVCCKVRRISRNKRWLGREAEGHTDGRTDRCSNILPML